MKPTLALLAIPAAAAAADHPRQASGTASVDLLQTRGPATSLASGFLYGFPDNGTSASTAIPSSLVTPLKVPASRGGGSQMPAPDLGWAVGGRESYAGRFDSALSNYRTSRALGADFILLATDLWGADGVADSGGHYPGDGGDWGEFEAFLEQLTEDIVENDMVEGLVFDVWNEPDLDIFWNRTWDQFLDLYVRAHDILRTEIPDLKICGPSFSLSPSLNNTNWQTWLSTIAAHDTIPDIYSWHHIAGPAPDPAAHAFASLLATHDLPARPLDVNEYAWPEEQNAAHSAWYLAQLERHDMRGLRANWGMGEALHDFMANLVFRDEEDEYRPTGEWYLYEYYASMEGERVVSSASEDGLFDAFGVVGGEGARILAGTASVCGRYEISVGGLCALGLPEEGEVAVRTLRFDYEGTDVDTGGPVNLGTENVAYSGDTLTLYYDPPNNHTGFAYEILAAKAQ